MPSIGSAGVLPPAPQPSPPPPPGSPPPASNAPFAGSVGSYGSAMRSQVFETIVRQALAGAPWREICQGPMQVNKITPEEVEEEVARRTGGKPQSAGQHPSVNVRVQAALKTFIEVSEKICAQLEAGTMPGADELERTRKELLDAMSESSLASHVPLMQRLLRTDTVELVAALRSKKSTVANLLKKARDYKDAVEAARIELEAALNGIISQDKFWEGSI